jgi:hypothetical protein
VMVAKEWGLSMWWLLPASVLVPVIYGLFAVLPGAPAPRTGS